MATPDPIDTSKLGPIKVYEKKVPWASPKECADDLRSMAAFDIIDNDGRMISISREKLLALAHLMDQWPDHDQLGQCVSNF